jgi:hypothetical protein
MSREAGIGTAQKDGIRDVVTRYDCTATQKPLKELSVMTDPALSVPVVQTKTHHTSALQKSQEPIFP